MNNSSILIQRTIANIGIEALNSMQNATLEAANSHSDIILLSPTGSGKTLAYLLPVLLAMNPSVQQLQAIIVAPTRELAQQIEQVWRSMGTGLKVNTCFGGRPSNQEKRDLVVPPALLIGTPGRLQDHIERGNIDTGSVRTLVLDEFDKSLEMGFAVQMQAIIPNIPNLQQRILTSATDLDIIPEFTGINNPFRLDFNEDKMLVSQLSTFIVHGKTNDKFELLYNLLCHLGNHSALVFCNQRDAVEKVSAYLTKRKLSNEFFHGKLEQNEREKALSRFRNGSCCTFISTDLASRGIDIPEIEHVIHFDIPVRLDEYIHRNGRTARMNAIGSAWSLLAANEDLPSYISPVPVRYQLPELVPAPPKPEWATIYIGKGKKDKLSKMDVVGFMFKIGQLEREDLGMVEVKDYYAYVAVKSSKVKDILKRVSTEKIKNMKTRIELAE